MKKILTFDNTETFLNEEVGETYHSYTGAVEEALKKYAEPCKIKDLAVSKARFSNAILALNSDDIRTAEEVENEYIRVGMMMKNHLNFLFDDYRPHPSIDQI